MPRRGDDSDAPDADAEARRASGTSDLHEHLEILTAFVDGIVFEFDRDGRYLRVWSGNPQLLARPLEALIGRTVSEVLGAETGELFHEVVREVYDAGEPRSFEYPLDVEAGRRIFSCSCRAHEPEVGGRRTVLLVSRDVTEAKALEAKLRQAERLGALGLLAASVNHEIRQPLSYVLASVDVMMRELSGIALSEEARGSLDHIRSGARRIAEITASLDVLVPKRGRSPTSFDVRRPIRAAIALCASELEGRARLELSLDEALFVRGDEGELSQVFSNLILNAAQAIVPARGAARRVSVKVRMTNSEEVEVVVADTGEGIAAHHRDRIFDPFYTTKPHGEGTGLGLYISRGILSAHGGTLGIESVEGRGTTVTVRLPLAGASGTILSADRSPGQVERVPLHVLVVDDEPRFLESLCMALRDVHHVVGERSSARALVMVTAEPSRFDVVLCDLTMPTVDGAAFHARMIDLAIADRFVLMSGGAYTSATASFVADARCVSITKPFGIEELLTLLDTVRASRGKSSVEAERPTADRSAS